MSLSILSAAGMISACGNTEFQGNGGMSAQGKSSRIPAYKLLIDPDLAQQFSCGNNGKKVEICHVPPGNPANAHTLCIGAPAVAHHLANHHAANGDSDYLGACGASVPDGGGDNVVGGSDNPTGGMPGGGGSGGSTPPGGNGNGGSNNPNNPHYTGDDQVIGTPEDGTAMPGNDSVEGTPE